jgi:hypothetical protein
MVCGEDVLNICWVTCHEESRAAWTSLHLEVAPSCSKDGSEVVMEVAEIRYESREYSKYWPVYGEQGVLGSS